MNPRDKYVARVLLSTGFRVDDLMHVRAWQLSRPVLEIVERKTGKLRSVPLPEELRRSIPKERGAALRYAFPSLHVDSRKMHRTTFYRHFREAVALCGWGDRGYSPHSLRKCYAVKLYKARGLPAVQEDLGHTCESTTMRYALADVLTAP